MQHDVASTCMYKIDSNGMQHDEAGTCMYMIDRSGLQHGKASMIGRNGM